jgi:hypothetical protein
VNFTLQLVCNLFSFILFKVEQEFVVVTNKIYELLFGKEEEGDFQSCQVFVILDAK